MPNLSRVRSVLEAMHHIPGEEEYHRPLIDALKSLSVCLLVGLSVCMCMLPYHRH